MTTTALILRNEAAIRRANALLRLCERETGFVISSGGWGMTAPVGRAHVRTVLRAVEADGKSRNAGSNPAHPTNLADGGFTQQKGNAMSKHTPGPWAWYKCGDKWLLWGAHGIRPVVLDCAKGHLRVRVDATCLMVPFDPHHPDARLIAAAPELLEACKKAYRELNEIRARDGVPYTHYGTKASVLESYFSSVVDECQAAIAGAESTGCASRDCGTSVPALNRATNPLKEP